MPSEYKTPLIEAPRIEALKNMFTNVLGFFRDFTLCWLEGYDYSLLIEVQMFEILASNFQIF